MSLPFTLEQLLEAVGLYNLEIWPLPVLAYILAIAAAALAVRPTKHSDALITAVLALFWLWSGIGFVLQYFGPLFAPAYGFAVLYILQGFAFLATIPQPRITFRFRGDAYAYLGLVFIAYGMLGYPLVGYFLGHTYPQSLTFGVTPCPVAIFTFGLYLLSDSPIPKLLLVVPFLWGIGGVVPVAIGILEDAGLIVAGLLGTALILYRDRQAQVQPVETSQ